jgi:hypothetical protein
LHLRSDGHERARRADESERDLSDLNTTDRRWLLARERLIAFIHEHGRYPLRRSGSDEERYLGEWIHRQRRLYRAGAPGPLTVRRIAKLEEVPGWEWHPVRRRNPRANRPLSTPDVIWDARYQELAEHLERYGRLPRLDGEQARLRRWLYGQERRLSGRSDPLSTARLARLRRLPTTVPVRRSRTQKKSDGTA